MKKITFLFIFFFYHGFSQTPIPFYPNSDASGTDFGTKVDVFNSEILVSSNSEMLSESASVGKVYLFNTIDNALQQTTSFYPDDALISDKFGASISIHNDFIAIGAPFHDANFENSGAVYLYHKVDGVYQLMQKITATDANTNDNFGSFVKVYNNQLFISAAGDEPDGQDINADNGSVYVYALVGTEWTFSEKIAVAISKHFGQKVEAENNTIVIAFDNPNGTTSDYSLYTYVWNNTHWTYENQLYWSNTQQGDNDFSLSNNELFIVTTGSNNVVNSIKFYSKVGAAWVGVSTLDMGPDNAMTKIKVNNNTMFLGSTKYTLQAERNFPLRIFKRNGNYWNPQFTIHGTGPTGLDDYFGSAIASQGNAIVIGAPKEGPSTLLGKAYYLDMATLETNDFEKKSSSVYPNPTPDIVYVWNNTLVDIVKTEVYNVAGSLLLTDQNSNQISLEKYAQGIYFLKVYYQNHTEETFKIIKN
ncbi:T9SS type A sorting domain-containing protein [Flavobacterium sp.]|uniref:T9SS type A sorting domain-containing protein n=1 Tax=Flavobacterium sp. TaxID=239 RepID=UPI00286D53AE|nr:T9SS type A sorting domain-containing protein [Flavobacterium sp.]